MPSLLSICCANNNCGFYTMSYSDYVDQARDGDGFFAPSRCVATLHRTIGERERPKVSNRHSAPGQADGFGPQADFARLIAQSDLHSAFNRSWPC